MIASDSAVTRRVLITTVPFGAVDRTPLNLPDNPPRAAVPGTLREPGTGIAATQALQHAGQPARADRCRSGTRSGDARSPDRVPARAPPPARCAGTRRG